MSFFFRKSTWGSAPDAKKAKTLNQAATALGVNEFMDQLRAALPAECMNTTKLDYDDARLVHFFFFCVVCYFFLFLLAPLSFCVNVATFLWFQVSLLPFFLLVTPQSRTPSSNPIGRRN
jgi:hypothetical protein